MGRRDGRRGDKAQTHCDEATQLADQLTDEELARRLATLAHLASADVVLDRFPAATRHAQRALQIGRRTGQGELFPLVVAMLGVSLWVQGRPLEAGELFDGAAEAARLVGNVQNLAWNLFNRSLAALAARDLNVALATAQESFELLQDMEPGPYSGAAAAALASALLETGQADRSVHVLLTRAGGEELQLIGGGWRARFLELLTRALLAVGRRADAERAAESAQACADAVALPSAAAWRALRRPRSPSTQASQRRPPSGRSRQPPRSNRSQHTSTRPARGNSRDEHLLRQATATVRRSSSSSPQRHSAPSARSGTATRQSASCESSAGASIAKRVQARPADQASSR